MGHSSWCDPNIQAVASVITRRREQRHFSATSPKIYGSWSKHNLNCLVFKGNLENTSSNCLSLPVRRKPRDEWGLNTEFLILSRAHKRSWPYPPWMDACTLVTVCGCESMTRWNWWENERNQFCLMPPSSPTQSCTKLCCTISPHHWLQWEHLRSYKSPKILQQKLGRARPACYTPEQSLYRKLSALFR